MVSVIILTCPSCGARLDYTGGERIVRCRYCEADFPVQNELNDRVKRGFQLIAQSNYSQAINILEEAALIDHQNGKVFFGMLLCDLKVNSPAKLSNIGFDFTRMPNYVNAINYLDQGSKNELEQLAQMNKQNMSASKPASSYPTPLMTEFNNANNCTIEGRSSSYISFVYVLKDASFEKKMSIFGPLKDKIEHVFELYKKLSLDERKNLAFFDDNAAQTSLQLFEQFKQEYAKYEAAREEERQREAQEDAEAAIRREQLRQQMLESDDEEEDFDEEIEYEEVNDNQRSSNRSIDTKPAEIVIETCNYMRLSIKNVVCNVSKNNNTAEIRVKCRIDQEGNFCNKEGYRISIIAQDRQLFLQAESDLGLSTNVYPLGSVSFVGDVKISGVNINSGNVYVGNNVQNKNNMSGIVIGGIVGSNNAGNANESYVVINGNKYTGDFTI